MEECASPQPPGGIECQAIAAIPRTFATVNADYECSEQVDRINALIGVCAGQPGRLSCQIGSGVACANAGDADMLNLAIGRATYHSNAAFLCQGNLLHTSESFDASSGENPACNYDAGLLNAALAAHEAGDFEVCERTSPSTTATSTASSTATSSASSSASSSAAVLVLLSRTLFASPWPRSRPGTSFRALPGV